MYIYISAPGQDSHALVADLRIIASSGKSDHFISLVLSLSIDLISTQPVRYNTSSLHRIRSDPDLTADMDERTVGPDRAPPYPDLDTVLEHGQAIPPPHQHHDPALQSSSVGSYVMHHQDTLSHQAAHIAVVDNPTVAGNMEEIKDPKLADHLNANQDYKLVTFAEGDPANPKNWSKAYKWWCTMVVAVTCFVVAFASSVITADIAGVAEEFNVSEEAALVSISVFVVGFGVGPMIFAPLSEVYGRQVI